MKKISLLIAIPFIFCFFQACHSRSKDDLQNTDSTIAVTVVDSSRPKDAIVAQEPITKDTTPGKPALTPAADDEKFAVTAANGCITEIVLSKLATQHAVSRKIKAFANMVITDHIPAGDRLKAVAKGKNIVLPPGPLGNDQTIINRLSEASGADFDKMYADQIIAAHKGAIALFEDESENGSDDELKAFALSMLPMLNKQLNAITIIKNGMK